MKLIALIAGIVLAYNVTHAADHFKAGEFNLDLYGTASIANEARNKEAVSTGLGSGLTYWATKNLGFGVRAEANEFTHSVVDYGAARISVRAPLWDTVAPYGYAEGGYNFEADHWHSGAGGGLDIRLSKGWGVFGEAGLDVTTRGAGSAKCAAGIRLAF
jgi:hypothetical protein